MRALLSALVLSTLGTVRDEGHCLDQRAFVLTRHEMQAVEAEVIALRVDVAALKVELKAAKLETAQALETQAVCLTAPAAPCNCSEWTAGLIGSGVGVLSCGTFWLGARM